jgi:hypothetical protein
MDAEELEIVAEAGRAAGDEHVFAVRRPAHDGAAVRVPGDAAGNAARGRDDVGVGVAVQVGRVGDPIAVGRVERTGATLAVGGEPLGLAALAANRPDVVGIAEGDLILAEGGVAKQGGAARSSLG